MNKKQFKIVLSWAFLAFVYVAAIACLVVLAVNIQKVSLSITVGFQIAFFTRLAHNFTMEYLQEYKEAA